jgi:hypothetical protein
MPCVTTQPGRERLPAIASLDRYPAIGDCQDANDRTRIRFALQAPMFISLGLFSSEVGRGHANGQASHRMAILIADVDRS